MSNRRGGVDALLMLAECAVEATITTIPSLASSTVSSSSSSPSTIECLSPRPPSPILDDSDDGSSPFTPPHHHHDDDGNEHVQHTTSTQTTPSASSASSDSLLNRPLLLAAHIERCIEELLTIEQGCAYMYHQFGVDHRITEFVWRRLQQENPAYFAAYDKAMFLSGRSFTSTRA
eukprot:TRINITY_DN3197_c0_g1_i2.p1 TRINITY_DN3197_c0_g1~~TRINITY_DN3197_c0_g1_i2.p1  ORF type:complete len:191 (+),score=49.59 TRINITY_DN3197_c0_g1_i2:49-573(+)